MKVTTFYKGVQFLSPSWANTEITQINFIISLANSKETVRLRREYGHGSIMFLLTTVCFPWKTKRITLYGRNNEQRVSDVGRNEASLYDLFAGQWIEGHDLCSNFTECSLSLLPLSHTGGWKMREASYWFFSPCVWREVSQWIYWGSRRFLAAYAKNVSKRGYNFRINHACITQTRTLA